MQHLVTKEEVMKFLLYHEADVNAQNLNESTALHLLLRRRVTCDTVKLLLDYNVNVNIKDSEGDIPLNIAIRGKNVGVVKILVNHGSDVNNKNFSRSTPLHMAAVIDIYEKYKDIFKILLDNGADINAQDSNGNTPIHQLVKWRSDPNKLELLFNPKSTFEVDVNININCANNDGATPLHEACSKLGVKTELLECLVNYGADINALDNQGRTPTITLIAHHNRCDQTNLKRSLEFFIKYSDIPAADSINYALAVNGCNLCCKIISEFFAKFEALVW